MNFKEKLIKIKDIILAKEDDYHEFEPLLTEIEDSPLNPIGNTVFWTIIIFMFIAGLWMYFGKVDIVITARGMVIPAGEEKVIQSLDKGVVTEIPVNEGQYVHKGEVVAIVSPAEYEPELELNNIRQEEVRVSEQIASDSTKLRIANDKRARLNTVKDIIPKARYDEAVSESTELSHNIGGVVTPAQPLLTIVPKNADLMIKAQVMNQDAGFVETGMPVSIKVDTYNFQKYGILKGIVTVVSPNSVQDEKLGPVYEVYIKPENTNLVVEGKEQSIKFGMSTTNEIKIGKRRIIEFFIYPLIKYLDESIKVS